jgi:hypothetical protein
MKNKTMGFSVLLPLLLLFSFRLPAAAEVVFQAKVSTLSQVASSYSEGKESEGPVELVLPGKLFDPPRAAPLRKKSEADLSTVEEAFATEKSAIIADDEDWILSNWVAEERETIQRFLANGELRKKNRDFMEQNKDMKISGVVELKGHTLVLIAGQGMVFTYKNVKGRWLRSNALFADDGFGVVFSAWRLSGKVFER